MHAKLQVPQIVHGPPRRNDEGICSRQLPATPKSRLAAADHRRLQITNPAKPLLRGGIGRVSDEASVLRSSDRKPESEDMSERFESLCVKVSHVVAVRLLEAVLQVQALIKRRSGPPESGSALCNFSSSELPGMRVTTFDTARPVASASLQGPGLGATGGRPVLICLDGEPDLRGREDVALMTSAASETEHEVQQPGRSILRDRPRGWGDRL